MHNIYTDVFCEYCSFGTVDVKVLKCFYMKCFMHIRLMKRDVTQENSVNLIFVQSQSLTQTDYETVVFKVM